MSAEVDCDLHLDAGWSHLAGRWYRRGQGQSTGTAHAHVAENGAAGAFKLDAARLRMNPLRVGEAQSGKNCRRKR